MYISLAAMCVCVRSAGVGRTGVFITLSIVLERMRYEGAVDIFQTVKMLRTQRPAMVQTEVGLSLTVENHGYQTSKCDFSVSGSHGNGSLLLCPVYFPGSG